MTEAWIIWCINRNVVLCHYNLHPLLQTSKHFCHSSPVRGSGKHLPTKPLFPYHFLTEVSRVWVVQEVTLAPEARCLCGKLERNMLDILMCTFFLAMYHRPHISDSLYDSGLGKAAAMWQLSFWYLHCPNLLRIDNLINRVRNLRAFDARDKVFGVLGLHTQKAADMDNNLRSRLLTPDYAKSVADLFRDSLRYSFMTSYGQEELFQLNRVSHRNEQELRADGFPSWVLRFEREYDYTVCANERSHTVS